MTPLFRVRLLSTLLFAGVVVSCADEGVPSSNADNGDTASVYPANPAIDESVVSMPAWVSKSGGLTLFEHVTKYAQLRASSGYRASTPIVPQSVADLTYVQYRSIAFRSDRAIWHEASPFEVQLFHPGGGNDHPVQIHLVEDGRASALNFEPGLFVYGNDLRDAELSVAPEAGYAGLKILFPLNDVDHLDEVVSFLGASYFRLLGPDQVYGLSSRGVAVDVARPDGEEFPDFVEFWLVRPDDDAKSMTFLSLLDGPSITGAFHFRLTPGNELATTVLDVEARLFARTDVGKLGVAPLTSMYLHGTFDRGGHDDFRPRVHDSEGLLMHTGRGEWIWRPLTNGDGLRLTSLRDVSPTGFGLAQRDRLFENYMDLEAQYHRRPSEWVQVLDDWGPGGLELLEIPTDSEFNDNVVASWVPDEPFSAGESRIYRYRLITFDERLDTEMRSAQSEAQALAQVTRTRIGWDALPGEVNPPPRTQRRVVVDFNGGQLRSLPSDAVVSAEAQVSSGEISNLLVQVLPDGGRRATFTLFAEEDRGADMRLYLRLENQSLSETWSYLWEPSRAP